MNRHALILLLASLLPACADAPPPPIDESASPIIGGTVDTGDPAVMLLISYPPDKSTFYTCTAELISPTVLITAAHCVDPAVHPGEIFGVFTGPDASGYPTADALSQVLLPVTITEPHPDYSPFAPFHADVGVVVLAQPVAVTPLPILRTPVDASYVGMPARIVGYGQTVYGQFNVIKHEATTVVAAIDPGDTILVGDSVFRTCVGDSGAPALVDVGGVETIIGLDSYTDTTGCIEPAHFRRTDLYASWFDSFVAANPPDAGTAASAAGVGGAGSSTSGGWGDGGGGAAPGLEDSSGGCTCALEKGRADGTPGFGALLLFPLAMAFGLRAAHSRRGRRQLSRTP